MRKRWPSLPSLAWLLGCETRIVREKREPAEWPLLSVDGLERESHIERQFGLRECGIVESASKMAQSHSIKCMRTSVFHTEGASWELDQGGAGKHWDPARGFSSSVMAIDQFSPKSPAAAIASVVGCGMQIQSAASRACCLCVEVRCRSAEARQEARGEARRALGLSNRNKHGRFRSAIRLINVEAGCP